MTNNPADPHPVAPAASATNVSKSAKRTASPDKKEKPVFRQGRSKQSRNQIVIFLNFLLSLAVIAAIGAVGALYIGKSMFEAKGPTSADETVLIRPKSGLGEIADTLERDGLVSSGSVFQIGVRLNKAGAELKAGEYEIKAGASMHEIMELMRSGKSILHPLTIPEGLTVVQALRRIADDDALSGEMPADIPPEGGMIADTTRFTRGMARADIVKKFTEDQQKLVETAWANRRADLPIKTINEFVTLASIVEKETAVADERPRIAGVFINRLNKGMRLQSDPTIVYGLFGGEGKPANRAIYRSDIDKPTPYNTYHIDGLPPTPIAIPGRAALEAVANPLQTNELYFVADGTGRHVFAKSLDEHNSNVARWRAFRKKQGQSDDTVSIDE